MNFNLPDFKVNNIYRLTLYVSLAILVGSFFFEIQNTFVCQVCQTDIFGHKLSFSSDVCYLRYVSFLLVLISLIAWGVDGLLQRPRRKLQDNIRFIEKMIEVSKDIDNKEKIKELIECYEYNYLEYNEEDEKYEHRRLCVDLTHFVALLYYNNFTIRWYMGSDSNIHLHNNYWNRHGLSTKNVEKRL